jgi:hypothetical protein
MENDHVVQNWNHSWVTRGQTIHDYEAGIVHCKQASGRNLPDSGNAAPLRDREPAFAAGKVAKNRLPVGSGYVVISLSKTPGKL